MIIHQDVAAIDAVDDNRFTLSATFPFAPSLVEVDEDDPQAALHRQLRCDEVSDKIRAAIETEIRLGHYIHVDVSERVDVEADRPAIYIDITMEGSLGFSLHDMQSAVEDISNYEGIWSEACELQISPAQG